jgi:hypothetical protein
MAAWIRRWRLAVLLVVAAGGLGCNMLSFPFFLLWGANSKQPPAFQLASKDKDHEIRVVILAATGLETRPEFLRVDRELANLLARQLQQLCKENKENVKLVPARKVDQFKDEHPNWKTMDLVKIGDYFDADYVIHLDIHSLSLYEPGSANQLFRGRADIDVRVVDVNEPDEDPVYRNVYRCEYPKTRGPIPVGDGSAQQFKQAFLEHVSKQLSWLFTAHPYDDEYKMSQ